MPPSWTEGGSAASPAAGDMLNWIQREIGTGYLLAARTEEEKARVIWTRLSDSKARKLGTWRKNTHVRDIKILGMRNEK